MTDLNDFYEEAGLAKEWAKGESLDVISIDDFIEIICNGHGTCEGPCFSKDICGEEACACIRSVFPTPDHYETYKLARAFFIENLAIRTVAGVASERIPRGFKGEEE